MVPFKDIYEFIECVNEYHVMIILIVPIIFIQSKTMDHSSPFYNILSLFQSVLSDESGTRVGKSLERSIKHCTNKELAARPASIINA